MNVNKKRFLVLFLINVLIVVHIVLWYKFGYQKIGTFSLNGIVSLFGFGLLNSAAAFFIFVVLITVFFGRLFCGWGCHFAFFQDLALKILHKAGIHPQIIHSKAIVIQYVFLLKTLTAIFEFWIIYGYPKFHLGFSDTQVMTVDLPRNPIIIASFVLFDAFLFIYLMGSRAFCRYVCPWAPMLAFFDNVSFWRIRKVDRCKGCMSCTRSCTMGIPVHEEIAQHGAVVHANCIRCLACTSACPNGTLRYRWGLSVISITRGIRWLIPRQGKYRWYGDFLLVSCGLIVAYYTQKWLGSFQTFLGAAWGLCLGMIMMKCLERRYVSISETIQRKRRFLAVGMITLSTLAWCWSTSTPPDIRSLLRGNRAWDLQEYDRAIAIYHRAVREFPSNDDIRAALALAYKLKGDYRRAIAEYDVLIRRKPDSAALHNNLGTVYYRSGNYDLAVEEYHKAIRLDEQLTAAYGNLGLVLLKKGDVKAAIPFLRKVFQNEEDMLKYIITVMKSDREQTG